MKWLTIVKAKQLIDAESEPEDRISRRQVLRRLKAIDKQVDGKLMRWVGQEGRGGTWEINASVLRQHLRANPVEHEAERTLLHDRIDAIDRRLAALKKKVDRQEKAWLAQSAFNSAQISANAAQSSLNETIISS